MIGHLFDLLSFKTNASRVWTEVDFMADLVEIPSERTSMLSDSDSVEVGFVLQSSKHWPSFDEVGQIVLPREPVIVGNAQDRISHNFDVLD